MRIEQLEKNLSDKGFKKEHLDTGIEYAKEIDHIQLICYIEPNINIAITTIYKWKNNDVKGGFTVSYPQLERVESVTTLFKETLSDMPEYVGERNIHIDIRKTIDKIFN